MISRYRPSDKHCFIATYIHTMPAVYLYNTNNEYELEDYKYRYRYRYRYRGTSYLYPYNTRCLSIQYKLRVCIVITIEYRKTIGGGGECPIMFFKRGIFIRKKEVQPVSYKRYFLCNNSVLLLQIW